MNNKRVNAKELNLFLQKQLWKSYDMLEVYNDIYYPAKIRFLEKTIILRNIDKNWQYHLKQMISLQATINLRRYGQIDPFIEYKNEAFNLFKSTLRNIKYGVYQDIFNFIADT